MEDITRVGHAVCPVPPSVCVRFPADRQRGLSLDYPMLHVPPMEMTRILEALLDPGAYPHGAEDLELHQTHISAVFLAGVYAYKLKKSIDLVFLDFTTLEKRRHYCFEEVRLNRRLAPDVYLGVVPLIAGPEGLRLGAELLDEEQSEVDPAILGKGEEVVEYAVVMRRLPDDATFQAMLDREQLQPAHLTELAGRMAEFHAAAEAGDYVAGFGGYDTVAGNAIENLDQSVPHIGMTISEPVHQSLSALLDRKLARLRPLIDRRADSGVPRDTHGDLHLLHVYHFSDEQPPEDLFVVDCIEFNERFRYADPVADIAFLVMDLIFHGQPGLGHHFADAYFQAAADPEGNELLSFYVSYRAAVRGKVLGFAAEDPKLTETDRHAAITRARAYWLLAMAELAGPDSAPGLVLVAGLPGAGKTTVAEAIAARADFRVLSSDRMRKEMAGLDPEASGAAPFGEGIYTADWNEQTYAALLERAEAHLIDGGRVVVDASFREDHRRVEFLKLAHRYRVPTVLLQCEISPDVVRERLSQRRGGISDADWAIYEGAAHVWEPASPTTAACLRSLDSGRPIEATLEDAMVVLRDAGLAD